MIITKGTPYVTKSQKIRDFINTICLINEYFTNLSNSQCVIEIANLLILSEEKISAMVRKLIHTYYCKIINTSFSTNEVTYIKTQLYYTLSHIRSSKSILELTLLDHYPQHINKYTINKMWRNLLELEDDLSNITI